MFGILQGNMRLDKVFLSSVSAGCLLSFSAASALSTNAASWYQDNAPGLIRTIGALVFPYGLVMIILTGADLCTGTFMVFPMLSEFICMKLTFTSIPLLPSYIAAFQSQGCFFTGSLHFWATSQEPCLWWQLFSDASHKSTPEPPLG